MKQLSTLSVLLSLVSLPTYAQIGTLDPSFSGDGLVSTDIGSSTYDLGRAIAVGPDGRIVVVGTSGYTKDLNFGVARYLTDGALDETFNETGRVSTQISFLDDHATAVTVQPDDRIVVGGYTFTPEGNRFTLVRYLEDGALDPDFGTEGITITDFPIGLTLEATCIALQPDGRILLAGGGATGFAVVRYEEDGTIDTSFGEEGLATCAFSAGNDRANAIALLSDGRIVLAGYAAGTGADSIAVARLTSEGDIDATFGTNGRVMASVPNLHTIGQSMAVGPDGEIVVAGYFIPAFTEDPAGVLVRFTEDGELDPAFNGTGIRQLADVGSGISMLNGVMVQPDGKTVACGWVSGATVDHVLIRLTATGELDATFNGTGITITDQTNGADRSTAVVRQADGRILVTGTTFTGQQDYNVAVMRFQAEGSVDVAEPATASFGMTVFPQPASTDATVRFTLDVPDRLTLRLIDASGREVITFIHTQRHAAGTHQVPLTGLDELPVGFYGLVLQGLTISATVPMVLER